MDTLARAQMPLDRDRYLRQLLGYLAESLQEVAGLEQAEALISIVGQRIGDEINAHYRQSLSRSEFSYQQVSAVLQDFMHRVDGDFYQISADDQYLVLGNRRCPFGSLVKGRPSLCMMTCNVFGVIAAENTGYARVEIQRAIAKGDSQCRVLIHLQSDDGSEAGREFFRAEG